MLCEPFSIFLPPSLPHQYAGCRKYVLAPLVVPTIRALKECRSKTGLLKVISSVQPGGREGGREGGGGGGVEECRSKTGLLKGRNAGVNLGNGGVGERAVIIREGLR